MEPPTDLPTLVEDLEANIDELTSLLAPLLSKSLSRTASTLPLLDKAKLHILAAYAIESLLFSSLLTSGQDAKSHAIFNELGRLKGYFGKLKDAEQTPESRIRVDKEAVGRFIRHGLSGNDRFDQEKKEREQTQKGRHIKFDQGQQDLAECKTKKRTSATVEEFSSSALILKNEPNAKIFKPQNIEEVPKTENTRSRKKRKTTSLTTRPSNDPTDATPFLNTKEQRRIDRSADEQAQKVDNLVGKADKEEMILPTRAPRTHSETFNALLQGPLAKKRNGKEGRNKGSG